MRIASLVPSATEALFALGVGQQVVAVTHECDHPAEVLQIPRLTHSVIPEGLEPGEIDARVREVTGRGEALYGLDEPMLARLAPDLIVTQALCAVCAVSYDDVRALAERLDSRPTVISLDPGTLGEVLDDLVRLAGPEDDALVPIAEDEWESDVQSMGASVEAGWEPPPLLAEYQDGRILLQDGNHRYEALTRDGAASAWVLVYFEHEAERDSFAAALPSP